MINKQSPSAAESLEGLGDGATVLVGGFGGSGLPQTLIAALAGTGVGDLTIVSNNVGAVGEGVATLIRSGQVRKVICSFPVGPHAGDLIEFLETGRMELELCPQGTLAERIRAGGAGIPAFYTPTGLGTELATGKRHEEFGGRTYLLESAIRADFALISADRADRWGNLTFNKAQRNFNPVMATAAEVTVAEVNSVEEVGAIEGENVITPAIYVDRLVVIEKEMSA